MAASRVMTVFRKELADVLRDRRTLIATIVVPVVLYPLLMLLSLQAVSIQTTRVAEERVSIGVRDEATQAVLQGLLEEEKGAIEKGEGGEEPASTQATPGAEGEEGTAEDAREAPTPLMERADVAVVEDLRQAVLDRRIQAGVVLAVKDAERPLLTQVEAELVFQPEEIRSQSAANRLQDMLQRVSDARVEARLAELEVDPRTIDPVQLKETRVSTPGSLLSLILPTLLVLMTVTSAIYPAIDLTAGEHERGTLESLLVCPVPALDLVVGKFLTVATIGLLGATLNLASVAATAYFGGLGELLAASARSGGGSDADGAFPWMALPIILLSLVPFSVLMAAILVAVCGCARSFKEAQNYITPVMIAVLMPAMVASLPGAKLEGLMLVLPVGNMVLLVRELLSGAPVPASAFATVIFATSAYAAAAVAIATQVFGKEQVMFADSVSLRALLSRKVARPRRLPALTLPALYAALLFPVWFYLQTLINQIAAGDVASLLRQTAIFMPVFFVALPVALLWYWKIDVLETLAVRVPTARHLAAGVLFGLVMWVAAQEVFVLQQWLLPTPEAMLKMGEGMEATIREQPLWLMVLCLGLVPGVCEELFFRGFLQSGLSTSLKKWTVLCIVAATFALFHFFLFRFGITFVLGLVLGWLCWQSRSIVPGIVAHAIHNSQAVVSGKYPQWQKWMGIDEAREPFAHLPWHVLAVAALVFAVAWALARKPGEDRRNSHKEAHETRT